MCVELQFERGTLPRRSSCQKHKQGLWRGISLLFLVFLSSVAPGTQFSVPGTAPSAGQPEIPKDAYGRTTPRGTVLGFLSAVQRGDNQGATQYLNTRLHGKAAADLAHQLAVVIDRRLPARLNQISDLPEGSVSDQLDPDQDLIATINSANGNVNILVERMDRGKSGAVWLFSRKTLESIPDIYEEINALSAEEVLPPYLVNTRIAGIALFHWLAVFVGMPLFYWLTEMLNRLLKVLVGRFPLPLYGKLDLSHSDALPKPIRLLLLVWAIRWILSKLSLPLLARQFWSNTATVIAIAACVWLLILVNSWGENHVLVRLQNRNLAAAASLLRLSRRLLDLLIAFGGIVVGMHFFGLNATAAVAGLGVGGIAVALAAQKTLENVIGGVSLILDQALRVGDTLKVNDISGNVDYIGLRSTRIRTFDRTLVSVPNGQIANMSLEILSSRDKFWFHPLLGLRYDTTSAQLRSILLGVRKLLTDNASVDQGSMRVRLLRLGSSSLDVDIVAYILAKDWTDFLEVQEELLFRVMEIVQHAGAQIAFPSQTVYFVADSERGRDGFTRRLTADTPDSKPQRETTAATSV